MTFIEANKTIFLKGENPTLNHFILLIRSIKFSLTILKYINFFLFSIICLYARNFITNLLITQSYA